MSPAISVLKALFRATTSRRRNREPITVEDLVVRVGLSEASVRRALRDLARADLVHRTVEGPRLTLGGLAVAAALAPPLAAPKKRSSSRPMSERRAHVRPARAA